MATYSAIDKLRIMAEYGLTSESEWQAWVARRDEGDGGASAEDQILKEDTKNAPADYAKAQASLTSWSAVDANAADTDGYVAQLQLRANQNQEVLGKTSDGQSLLTRVLSFITQWKQIYARVKSRADSSSVAGANVSRARTAYSTLNSELTDLLAKPIPKDAPAPTKPAPFIPPPAPGTKIPSGPMVAPVAAKTSIPGWAIFAAIAAAAGGIFVLFSRKKKPAALPAGPRG